MKFKEELSTLLLDRLPGAKIEFKFGSESRIGGIIISQQFEGLSQLDRQRLLWEHLDSKLPEAKRQRIMALLTMTPDEAGMACNR